jgi:hypothetical protein
LAKVTGGSAGEGGVGLSKLIVAALCRQQGLLDSLKGPGKVVVHFNPQNHQEPVSLEFNFKV